MYSLTIEQRVRYPDCDPMGVAHHSIYPIWFELARTELLRETGISYRDLEDAGVFMVITELSVKYSAPARYDDVVSITAECTRSSGVRIRHAYEVRLGDTLLATGKTTLACLDKDGRPRQVPENLQFES